MGFRERSALHVGDGGRCLIFLWIEHTDHRKAAGTAGAKNATGIHIMLENHNIEPRGKRENMRSRKLFLVFLVFALGALFGWQFAIYSQTSSESLRRLAEEKRDLTKMDWVLVNARLNALESPIARYSASPVTSAGFEFDSTKGRIVASAFVPREWFAKANLEKAKEAFSSSATDLCSASAGAALIKQGSPAAMDLKSACSVRFFTWTVGKSEGISTRDVALFEEGRLVLK
jgi:hypothetical protein